MIKILVVNPLIQDMITRIVVNPLIQDIIDNIDNNDRYCRSQSLKSHI